MGRFAALALPAVLIMVGVPGMIAPVSAQEGSLRLMRESVPFTDVADAFEEQDPFDLNLHLRFVRTREAGVIQREDTTSSGPVKGDVADYERVTSLLDLGIDIGLYHDVMATLRLPLTLSDVGGLVGSQDGAALLQDPGYTNTDGNDIGPLFGSVVDSPKRAGLDYLGLGVTWGIFNQHRQPHFPTWLVSVEGRIAMGDRREPCVLGADGTATCGSLYDYQSDAPYLPRETDPDGNVVAGTGVGQAQPGIAGEPGNSRGFSGIVAETRASWRYRYLEPYIGLGFEQMWATDAEDFFLPGGDPDIFGFVNRFPRRIGRATLGVSVVPWENRGSWQRFALDVRGEAAYESEGHDYSPLFDALGTAHHPGLAEPKQEAPGADDSITVPFYGLTDVQSRMRYGMRVALDMQAAQYVRFSFGAGLGWLTDHAISYADPCKRIATYTPGDARQGNCAVEDGATEGSIINPHYHGIIDQPGRRFWYSEGFLLDLFASAIAQF